MRRSIAMVGCVLGLSGCFFRNGGGGGGGGGGDQTAADVAELAALRVDLEAHRTQALDKSAMELFSVENVLYWKTYPGFSPQLHRRNGVTGARVDYGFSIGAGDDNNALASSTLVVNAERAGDKIVYHLWDATQPSTSLGEAQFAAPTDEQKWWAYSVSGSKVYVITTPSAATGAFHTLWRFTPGVAPAELTTLEAAGIDPGILMDFSVDGNTLMLIESGRLWRVDLTTRSATWLGNRTEIAGAVHFATDGVTYEDATGLKLYDVATQTTRDLSAEIAASPYRINETFASAHRFDSATAHENHTRWRDWVVYTGGLGIFGYHLRTGTIAPILLDVSDENVRIEYRYPVVLADGTGYFVGLTSTSGSVGADGPVYSTPLAQLLP